MSTDLLEPGGLLEPEFLALDDLPLRTSTIFPYLGTSIYSQKVRKWMKPAIRVNESSQLETVPAICGSQLRSKDIPLDIMSESGAMPITEAITLPYFQVDIYQAHQQSVYPSMVHLSLP